MSYFTFGYRLPQIMSASLFGDRKQFGLKVQPDDPCWTEWQTRFLDFYYSNQKQSIGAIVNNAGYKVMSWVDLSNKRVLEIGPGDINHQKHWRGKPELYALVDIQEKMLELASDKLRKSGINYECNLVDPNYQGVLPFADESFDVIVSFYSLEHLFPLDTYLAEMLRVLRKGGTLVGAIPAEGGLGWGLGRFLTSRRWLHKNTNINPDKIICWEHPNFADNILSTLDKFMTRSRLSFWPLGLPTIDFNLVIRFLYEKSF